ncbi:P-loop containing nucleoside triphosphate hydrolase protein [Mycena floridula]|nr:P-loop containing nucleoside triphosphate hydrolase protein [Mycena floridula]
MNAGKIRFDLLWALFPHRGLVYSYDSMVGQHAIYRVLSTETIEDEQKKLWFVLNCHVLKHDGMHFGLSIVKLDIEQFTGLVQIRNLTVYPLDLHPDKDILYQDAVALGRKIANMGSHVCYEYSSHAIRDQQFQSPRYRMVHDRRDDRIERFYSSSRVMISPSAFRRYLPDSAYNPCVFRALDASEVIEDDYAIICPIMLGFSLGMKCWGGFAMSHLREVEWNDSAFDSLVLGEKQKKLIRGLVFQHSLPENDLFDNVIKNKGHGLIGLLAGTPGCGKTLTAEALGVDPSHIEENLIRALELAHMWNTVILIDEAEVFLHQRIPAELQRNAAVAIFLRQLEYYQGMMILTTNMVEACDVALESRIHFLVHYPELDTAARYESHLWARLLGIWAMFASRAALTISDHELERLAAYAMNGRQIKNVFRSAQTLSLSNGSGKLSLDDVQIVIGVLQDWKEGAAAKTNRVH